MMGNSRFLLSGFILVALMSGVGGATIYSQLFQSSNTLQTVSDPMIEVQPGMSFNKVARELKQKDFIQSELALKLYAKLTGAEKKIKVGEYSIPRNAHPIAILQLLMSGKSVERPITVFEGANIFEIFEILKKAQFREADTFFRLIKDKNFIQKEFNLNLPTLEGYLFPSTYSVTKYTTARDLIRLMVGEFRIQFEKAKASSKLLNWKATDVVILASIIEKETGAPFERRTISSVFHNRIKKKMRLQTDPTVLYGKFISTGDLTIKITKADLMTPNSFNTYTFSGLPVGPISNPGFEALVAAMNPELTGFFYFVSRNDGTHVFSENYEQHLRAVSQYQLDRKAREGKSWRDLNQRK